MDFPIPSTAQKLHQGDVPWVNDLHGACNALQGELFRAVRSLIWYRAGRAWKATMMFSTHSQALRWCVMNPQTPEAQQAAQNDVTATTHLLCTSDLPLICNLLEKAHGSQQLTASGMVKAAVRIL